MTAKRKKKSSDYEKVNKILDEEWVELERETELGIRKCELVIDMEKHNILKLKKVLKRKRKYSK